VSGPFCPGGERHGDGETGGHGDAETRRRGDGETRGQGDGERVRRETHLRSQKLPSLYPSPRPRVSPSPRPPISASPHLPVQASPRPRLGGRSHKKLPESGLVALRWSLLELPRDAPPQNRPTGSYSEPQQFLKFERFFPGQPNRRRPSRFLPFGQLTTYEQP
jgi:hypothetical protein